MDYNFDAIVRQLGGKDYHTKGRERTRMMVRIRDGFSCKNCKSTRTIREVNEHNEKLPSLKGRIKLYDVHHIDGNCGKNSTGYDSTGVTDTMVTLCHKCHFQHHKFSKRAEGKWNLEYIPPVKLYKWGLTEEELKIKAPNGI